MYRMIDSEPKILLFVAILGGIYLLLIKKVKGVKAVYIILFSLIFICINIFFTKDLYSAEILLAMLSYYWVWVIYKTSYKGIKLVLASVLTIILSFMLSWYPMLTINSIIGIVAIVIERLKKKKVEIIEPIEEITE